jgi:hypothetical protein
MDDCILYCISSACNCEVEYLEGISYSDLINQILTQGKNPSVNSRKDHRYDMTICRIFFNQAKADMWSQCHIEVEHILQRADKLTPKNSKSRLILKMFDLFYGQGSEVFGVFHHRLGLSIGEFQ